MRLLLRVNNLERGVLKFDNEYFRPTIPDEKYYLDFLRKNFPYESSDSLRVSCSVEQLSVTKEDKKLADEARWLSGRNGLFDSDRKERYYRELMRLRYDARLDRGIIPNLDNLYDMVPRPVESRKNQKARGNLAGGIFDLTLKSTDDDLFFYEWFLMQRMEEGEIIFYVDNPKQSYVRIEFWDCYCVGIRDELPFGEHPVMHLRISPGIVRNHGSVFEEYWKVTDLEQEDFRTPAIAPAVPLVTSVSGAEESFPGGKVEYNVTGYSMTVDQEKRNQVNWAVSVDGAASTRISERGEKIVLEMKKEWEGKEIAVMPYLKTPTESVSAKTKVEQFIIPRILTETDRKAGLDESGEIARDMHFGKAEKIGGDWVFTHTDDIYVLNEIKDAEVRKLIEQEMEDDDSVLFERFRELVRYTSTGDLQTHNLLLVDKFQGRKITKPVVLEKETYLINVSDDESRLVEEHRHPILTEAVYGHERTERFIKYIKGTFYRNIEDNYGSINKIDWFDPEVKDDFLENKPHFSSINDTVKGLRIALNDTWGHRITLKDYKIGNNKYSAVLLIRIFDHFGLDVMDIDKFGSTNNILKIPGWLDGIVDYYAETNPVFYPYKKFADYLLDVASKGFRAWFILQHCKGYKPFITVMDKEITLVGEF